MYYTIGVSVSTLHRESTNSLIPFRLMTQNSIEMYKYLHAFKNASKLDNESVQICVPTHERLTNCTPCYFNLKVERQHLS